MKKYIVLFSLLFTGLTQAAAQWTFYAVQSNNLPAGVNIELELTSNNQVVETATIQAGQHFATTQQYPQGATLNFTINGQKTTIGNEALNKASGFNITGVGAQNLKARATT